MQALQRTVQMITGQLKGLSSTAKMLLGSLMIILVMALFLVSLYAGRRTMVPLGLGSNISAEARARAVSYLKSGNIPFETSGSEVLVPSDQKIALLAQLTESQVIAPEQINFDKLMSDDSPFRSSQQNRQRYLVAKMNVLASMISQMTGIEHAVVVLDAADSGNGLGSARVPASASVNVLTRSGELSQQQVDAIARLVAFAHAGLKPANVAIVDARTGRALQARTDDVTSASKYMDIKLNAERHVQATLESALGYIPGVRVAVNALVDTKEVIQSTNKYDEPKVGVTEDSTTTINSTGAAAGGQPGVQSNTGASIANSTRSGSQLTDERAATSSIPFVGTAATQIKDAKGYAVQINATVGVPKSYFVRLFQDGQPDAKKLPDQTELDAIVQAETQRIKTTITPLIDTAAMEGAVPGAVAVSMIPDFGVFPMVNGAVGGGSGGVVPPAGDGVAGGLVNDGLVKYVSLGGLAVLSLAMMFMMVRKAGAREELPTAAEIVGVPPALAAMESDLVGEADEAAPALEGVELTDEVIRRQQMLDQITEMVQETPEEAASLLRRWMRAEA